MNKKITAVIAAFVMVFALGICAGASGNTPRPESETRQTQSTPRVAPDTSADEDESTDAAQEDTEPEATPEGATAAPANGGLQNTYTTPIPAESGGFFSHSVSRGAMILWFVLAVAASSVISFFMGSRFAALAKKDNRLAMEVRALRRDIDEKMSERVGDFSEKELDIKNNGKKYFDDPKPEEIAQSGENMYEKWETQLAQTRSKRPVIKTKPATEEEQPAKHQRTEAIKNRAVPKPEEIKNSAKGRMQDVIEEMFPFDDDPR